MNSIGMNRRAIRKKHWKAEWQLHMLLLPAMVLLLIFAYLPMFGNIMAFQDYKPGLGFLHSKLVGLKYFKTLFALPNIGRVVSNTLTIAILKIVLGTLSAIILALLLNEIRSGWFQRIVQTIVYLPHFVSWVILGSILTVMLASDGLINRCLGWFGLEPVFFLGDNFWFRVVLIVSDIWKEVGFGTIIYLAAIMGVDMALYEAAIVDGAGRWKQTWHVTLPAMMPVIVLVSTLNLGGLLNAGFDQIFNMYNSLVMEGSDIIDTFVYRLGMESAKFSLATAVGLIKSLISVVLISSSYYLAYHFADYRVF